MTVNYVCMSKLGLASEQRLSALFHCLRIIDCFAAPGLSEEDLEKYEEVRGKLLEAYSDDIDLDNEIHLFL